jgi:hypothetical protein
MGTYKSQRSWMFTIGGCALMHYWLDQGRDSRDRAFTARELATLRPRITKKCIRVRRFDLDALRTK